MNFHNAARDIQALQDYLLQNRDEIFMKSLGDAKELCNACDVQAERRQRKKKKMPGEIAEDVGLTAENEMPCLMKSMLEKIHIEMADIFISLKKVDSNFGFLLDINGLMATGNESSLKQCCISMENVYDTDLDGLEMYTEIMDCRMLLKTRADVKLSRSMPEDQRPRFIVQYGEDVFPNLRVGLQILLTIGTSIASCERSFSKLKLILFYLRLSMAQERLSALALLSVEQQVAQSINFDELIDKFAAAKARKISL
ncbi:uncharacterized protein LOC118184142 [Stegodyphus dumicola]|uniref:uncharacterized protein LOC118184142 n=1 Tax=Stegodyphus dumicola TaxID=202533 RepID=UPI0015ABBEB4|nr:uncharacterized protein LOC118184142 [Stegodyphus dumicola]